MSTARLRTALVTGITGQDGGYLADLLVSQGVTVHGLTLPGEQAPAHLPADVVLHEADLLDGDVLGRLVREIAPEEIYNLAGLSSVAQSWEQPVLTARVNGEVVARLLGR